ncbi:aminotransferase class V-fold PLP-dependent enzyme [Robertkochia flava]|uniref:aminotransferase class V-fold PLP-dependent enzyme n=1 Tax=Robertkochia flava TaxID=3447986 RepID=UPI001CCA20D3|nr:aminotransferase class V-fold PLP-dependent enzyme [Robertkochia marina]
MEHTGHFGSQFPYTQQYTYLNTPAYGLLSESLMEWRQEHDLDYLVGGSRFKERFIKELDGVRATVASFTNTTPDRVYLTPNFSFGWKVLCGGLKKDLHFLLLDGDYPSLNWPVITSGFKKTGTVKASFDMEEEILRYFERHAPDVFAFSLVQYLSGLQLGIDFLRSLKEQYPDTLFVADATQYLGVEEFDFERSGIDVLGASGYKWMLAGTGNGFFLVRPEVASRFYEHSMKWEPREEWFLRENTHLQNHLEPGHLDSMAMGSLKFALDQLGTLGMETVEHRVRELKDYAREALGSEGFLEEGVLRRKDHAPFFALEVSEKQLAALEQRHVVFAIRNGRLRVGFHYYNKKEEVDKLVNILKHSLPR